MVHVAATAESLTKMDERQYDLVLSDAQFGSSAAQRPASLGLTPAEASPQLSG
jgi:hypothetical protein